MIESSNKRCPMCAEGIRGDEIDCPHCGSALQPAAPIGEPKSPPMSTTARLGGRKLGVIIGVAAVILVGGAAAAVVLLRPAGEPEKPTVQAAQATSPPSVPSTPSIAGADATLAALQSATYHFAVMTDDETVITLKKGKYTGQDYESAELVAPEMQTLADVDGDGFKEAIGLLWYGGGGSMSWQIVVVVDGSDSAPKQRAAWVLGDRDVVKKMTVSGDVISLDMIVHTENDPDCCPSRRTKTRLQLRGDKLVEAGAGVAKAAGGAGDGNFLSGLPQPSDPVTDAAGARGHLKKGRLLERAGQHDAAIAEYIDALRLSPSMPTPGKEGAVWGELGYALMNAERYDDAEAVCKRALDVGGDGKFRSSVNYNMGVIAKKTGRARDAIRYFEAAIAANPDNKVAAAKLAELRGN